MKCVLEFGVRGGQLTESVILDTQKLGAQLAANLVRVFTNKQDNPMAKMDQWKVRKDLPRKSWQSSTHFVSLTVLDGKPRGCASASLWKKDNV